MREGFSKNCMEIEVIVYDFYVDDLVTGTRTQEETLCLKSEIYDLLKQNGFELHELVSNDSNVSHGSSNLPMDAYLDQESSRIPGVLARADISNYNMLPGDIMLKYLSKRTILSLISKSFDRLGLIVSIIIQTRY